MNGGLKSKRQAGITRGKAESDLQQEGVPGSRVTLLPSPIIHYFWRCDCRKGKKRGVRGGRTIVNIYSTKVILKVRTLKQRIGENRYLRSKPNFLGRKRKCPKHFKK